MRENVKNIKIAKNLLKSSPTERMINSKLCPFMMGMFPFPPYRYGLTDGRTDKVNYRVTSLLKSVVVLNK